MYKLQIKNFKLKKVILKKTKKEIVIVKYIEIIILNILLYLIYKI